MRQGLIAVGLVAVSLGVPVPAAQPAATPAAKAGPRTYTQYMEASLAYLRTSFVDVMTAGYAGPPELRGEYVEQMADQCRHRAGFDPTPDIPHWLARVDALAARGCREPQLMASVYAFEFGTPECDTHPDEYGRLVESLAKSGAPRWFVALHARALYDIEMKRQRPLDAERWEALFVETLMAEIAAPIPDPVVRQFRGEILVTALGTGGVAIGPLDRFAARLEAAPGIDPWLKGVALGLRARRKAWEARGDGTIDMVTSKGLREFDDWLTKAEREFKSAWDLDPSLPIPAAQMITVATGLSGSKPAVRAWFDKAESAVAGYTPAEAEMLWALRPRWIGSHGEMIAFGREQAKSASYDTSLPWSLIAAYDAIGEEKEAGYSTMWKDPKVYAECKPVIERMLRGRLAPDRKETLNSQLAAMAFVAEDFTTLRKALEGLPGRPDERRVQKAKGVYENMVRAAYLHGPGANAELTKALAAARADDWPQCAAALERGLAAKPAARSAAAARDLLAEARVRVAMAAPAAWIPMTFEPGIPGWQLRAGELKGSPDAARTPEPAGRGLFALRAAAPLGLRWEARATLRQKSTGNARAAASFILYRTASGQDPIPFMQRFYLAPDGTIWVTGRGQSGSSKIDLPAEGDIAVHLQVWDDEYVLRVNDRVARVGKIILARGEGSTDQFGLSVSYTTGTLDAHFRDVQVRRLEERPADARP